jgi:branched-chain amino acid transport system permease protein
MGQPQLWLSAIEMGCFFGLLALAYYLVLVGAGFFNFAIGPYAMMGGLCTSYLVVEKDMGVWAAAGVAILATMALAAATELVVVRPVQKRSGKGELPALVAVAAVLFAIQQLAGYLFGYVTLPGQNLVTFDPVTVGSTTLQPSSVLLFVMTVVVFTAAALATGRGRAGSSRRGGVPGDPLHAAGGGGAHRAQDGAGGRIAAL